MSSSSPLHRQAAKHCDECYKHKQRVIFEPARTHHLGLKAQNFENPIFKFRYFSLKAVYNSCILRRRLQITKFLFMYSFAPLHHTLFFSVTYLLKLSS